MNTNYIFKQKAQKMFKGKSLTISWTIFSSILSKPHQLQILYIDILVQVYMKICPVRNNTLQWTHYNHISVIIIANYLTNLRLQKSIVE